MTAAKKPEYLVTIDCEMTVKFDDLKYTTRFPLTICEEIPAIETKRYRWVSWR